MSDRRDDPKRPIPGGDTLYRGRRLDSLTREELIAALLDLHRLACAQSVQHYRDMQILSGQ